MKAAVTLKKNHEFRRLYQKGASAVAGSMVLYCRKNRLGHNRLGVTVSVKLGAPWCATGPGGACGRFTGSTAPASARGGT